MLLEAKKKKMKRTKDSPRLHLEEKKEKKLSCERKIKVDRTGSATRKTDFTAEDSTPQQDFGHFKMAGKVLRRF
jgi:hypothetical protein